MKKNIVGFVLCLLPVLGFSQGVMPSFTGVDLNGKDVFIPGETKGKYTIIGFMSSLKAQEDLLSWYEPISDNFDWDEDVNIYFTAVLGGMAQNNSNAMKQKMREVVLEEYYDNVIVFLGNTNEFVKKLKIQDESKPYFFVLDPKGEIIYKCSGKYTEKKLDDMIIAIDGEITNEDAH